MSSGNCEMCNKECSTCSGLNNTDCLSCRSDSKLVNNRCVPKSSADEEDGLSVQGMKILIGFSVSACGLACLITVVYKLCKKDAFFQEIESEVKEEENRRKSGLGPRISEAGISLQSNIQIGNEEGQSNVYNDPQPNYAGLTIIIDNKVSNFKKIKENKSESESSKENEGEKKEKDENEKNVLETINESLDEEKSSILVKKRSPPDQKE